jgi:hypothetical protein
MANVTCLSKRRLAARTAFLCDPLGLCGEMWLLTDDFLGSFGFFRMQRQLVPRVSRRNAEKVW